MHKGHTRTVKSYDAVYSFGFHAVDNVIAQSRYSMAIQQNFYFWLPKSQQSSPP